MNKYGKIVGRFWNDKEIPIIEYDKKMYALYGWDGEKYRECWRVLDVHGLKNAKDRKKYTFREALKMIDDCEYETLGYIEENDFQLDELNKQALTFGGDSICL